MNTCHFDCIMYTTLTLICEIVRAFKRTQTFGSVHCEGTIPHTLVCMYHVNGTNILVRIKVGKGIWPNLSGTKFYSHSSSFTTK